MKLYSAEQMRRCDRAAAEAGVASVLLMEAAGRAVADAARRRWPRARRLLVLCGPGNNGGDGYVAARYLLLAGCRVTVLETSSQPRGDDARGARAALAAHLEPQPLEPARLAGHLAHAELVIDALLGSGLTRPLDGTLEAVAAQLRERGGRPLLAVDVPTGVSSDRPEPPGAFVRADATVQLAGPKLSSALDPARDAYGAWEVADIGIPAALLDAASEVVLLDDDAARAALPRRERHAHKYGAGTVLVVAGSPRYQGAAELACRGASRAGAGLVTLAAAERHPSGWPEVILEPIRWHEGARQAILAIDPKRAGAVVAGPGLDAAALPELPALLAHWRVPVVLDAGALAPELREAVAEQRRCVLTPHAGEAARLLGVASDEVTADPLHAARLLAEAWRAVVALKGPTTVVAAPDGRAWVSTRGHPGMASGGVGDVLAGGVGALLAAAGEADPEVVAAAVYLHGCAGERAARRLGVGLSASDVAEEVAGARLRLDRGGARWRA